MDVSELQVDMATIVGHKYGAPKGVAALYIREGLRVPRPLLMGGGQEHDLRAGTESMLLIAGLGAASELVTVELQTLIPHFLVLRLRLIKALNHEFEPSRLLKSVAGNPFAVSYLSELHESGTPFIKYNGPSRVYNTDELERACSVSSKLCDNKCLDTLTELMRQSLLNTVSVSFKGLEGHQLVSRLGRTVACSAGSACHTVPAASAANQHGTMVIKMSDVLQACGVSTNNDSYFT